MIDIKYLSELFPFLNLKALCDESNLNYSTIKHKIYRYRKNQDFGHLTYEEMEKLSVGLGKKGLKTSNS